MKTKSEYLAKFRHNHHLALETLRSTDCQLSGIQLWRKCRKLEQVANAITTAACNSEVCVVYFPMRAGVRKMPVELNFYLDYDKSYDYAVQNITSDISAIFGHVPKGFFVNFDARGYALKLSPELTTIPNGMHQDWGGNGILAAEIN